MTIAFVTNDWHLGKPSPNVDLSKELDLYVDWLCKEAENFPTIDDKYLIVAGDLFDPKKSLTIAQKKQADAIFNKLNNVFDKIYFVLGNHDVPGKSVIDESLFDFFEFGHEDFYVIKTLTRVTLGGADLILCPYGHFKEVPFEGERDQVYITHNNERYFLDLSCCVYNAHTHTFSKPRLNMVNLGTPYQLEWSNVGNPGGYVVFDENAEGTRVPYPRETFKRIRLEDGKIEGKNPVKWLTENKKVIEGICLEVSVAEDTDKTLYSKFLGVLNTVNLAALKLVDDISFTTDLEMSNSKPNFADSLNPLLTRDGAKLKLKDILVEIGD